MTPLVFDNRFVADLPGDDGPNVPRQVVGACWSRVAPTSVAAPRLVAAAPEVAALLGLAEADLASPAFAEVFAGNRLLPGMEPWAACYGGHQFGHWAGQLGDGRAISLGEVVGPDGRRWEVQLKGAGPTPYSRRADGRAVLRSSVREFLCSEAMHHLGVPTTRALALVATGEAVVRDLFYDGHPREEPGAVVTRVAPTFVRFGSFEIFAARGDADTLARLLDWTIAHHAPDLDGADDARRGTFFARVAERTARLMADWMRLGFVHGVMNTDNLSILGLTIDYGPYGWLDDVDPDFTPNTTDADGRRYRYAHQPLVAQWNLARLAEALSLVVPHEALRDGLDHYGATFVAAHDAAMAAKLGLPALDTPERAALARDVLPRLHATRADFTLFFRALGDLAAAPDLDALDGAALVDRLGDVFYEDEHPPDADVSGARDALADWLGRWREAARDAEPSARRAAMHAVNPRFVLRNWLTHRAAEQAEAGDDTMIHALLDAARRPYDDGSFPEGFVGKRPAWARTAPGAAMLSCSS